MNLSPFRHAANIMVEKLLTAMPTAFRTPSLLMQAHKPADELGHHPRPFPQRG